MRAKRNVSKRSNEAIILGQSAFAAICAVEGLKLTTAGWKRVEGTTPIEQRRSEVLRVYSEIEREVRLGF